MSPRPARGDDTVEFDIPDPAAPEPADTGATPSRDQCQDLLPPRLVPDPLRDRVVRRLGLVGRRHARVRAEHHRTPTEPGPHAVVFFYRQPTAGRVDDIAVATRMFLAGDDVTDLTAVLGTLYDRALDYLAAGAFDPREHLCQRAEPMTGSATYLGVGASSLLAASTPTGDPPWAGLARLLDGTRLTARRPIGGYQMEVESSHTLDAGTALTHSPAYTWRWVTRHRVEPEHGAVPDPEFGFDLDRAHHALAHLHYLLSTSASRRP